MRNIFAIARKEIKSSFVTPVAYVVMAGFLLISGFFFFSLLQQYNTVLQQAAMMPDVSPNLNEWVVVPFYQTLEIILIFIIPILTMRSVAEEKRQGTFELLATSPISVGEIVWGKFFGVSFVCVAMLLLGFIFPAVLIVFADPEVPPIFIGFLGMLLFSLSFVALGVAVSTTTKSQTVAGIVSLVALLLLYIIDAPAAKLGEGAAAVFRYMAPSNHSQQMLKGVLAGGDMLYFFSLIALGIFISNRVLDAGRWR